MNKIRSLLRNREISSSNGDGRRKFGGLIFTSQRAVEAFTEVVKEEQGARKDTCKAEGEEANQSV